MIPSHIDPLYLMPAGVAIIIAVTLYIWATVQILHSTHAVAGGDGQRSDRAIVMITTLTHAALITIAALTGYGLIIAIIIAAPHLAMILALVITLIIHTYFI